MTGVVAFQDKDGLLFYRVSEIASLTPEYAGRWRAVTSDGSVLHRPDFPTGYDWCQLVESFVNPRHLRQNTDTWMDPADFEYLGEITGVAPVEPVWPDLDLLALQIDPDGTCRWITSAGSEPYAGSLQEMAEQHSHWICCGKQWWINPHRLRRLRREGHRYHVELDDGRVLTALNKASAQSLASGLGLPGPDFLGRARCLLTERELRDYPLELDRAPAERLKLWFQTERQALANIIYQTVRYRQQGKVLDGYGTDHSSYLYKPIYSIMVRAGFWNSERILRMDPALRKDFEVVLNDLIGRDALFTYQQLGFEDEPSRRHIGDRRPEVVLVFEKTGFRRYAEELSQRFGISYIITAGMPKLLNSEFLAAALARAGGGPIRIIAFTDYDPAGWIIAEALAAQLARYGVESKSIDYLVRAERFTAQEIELFSYACSMGSASLVTAALEWVKKSGGINGLARGMHANHFQPLERVAAELEKLL